MKILFVSMPSVHVTRWLENFNGTPHELFWFDVLGRGKLETNKTVQQITDWKRRKIPKIKGEYLLSRNLPSLYAILQPLLEITANEKLKQIIKEIQPDIIHTFEMQSCSYLILETMNKFSSVKWIYSCWGNDLYYYKNIQRHKSKITNVLKRVNYLHTDCERDHKLAVILGFKGKFLGVIPGGTGYRIEDLTGYKIPINERKIILVKGYEHLFGRGLNVVKALHLIQNQIEGYEVVVFGAHQRIIDYIILNKLKFKVFNRHALSHEQLMRLMGRSLIYIGNSISDGMPNTLLEAIVMGAFPIQSNPGGVTEEIINDGINGFLIENPENINEIKNLVIQVILNQGMIQKAVEINIEVANKKLDYKENKKKVIDIYSNIVRCE